MSQLQSILLKRRGNIPIRVALIYAFFSTMWIVFSDRTLLAFIDDIEFLTMIQTIKGWFFIAVTTLLIFYLLKREISEVKKMEEALIQSEKMLSISHLATGMANQINNPLAGIVQNAQILRNRLTEEGKSNLKAAEETGVNLAKVIEYAEKREISRILNSIVQSGKNASELIDNMLAFSREGSSENELKDPAALLDATIDLLKQDNRFSAVEIKRDFGEPSLLRCDPQKLKHALFHILTNAMEAAVEPGIEPLVSVKMRVQGKNLEISITDKGAGMSEKMKTHIYEPFFSTKTGAKGMGLAIANFIISEIHKGNISVISGQGQGASFIISLPVQQ
ncbi:sensor histidine kinase [Spirochaeta isovalerica]|uniref:histidine kinase n=1 Tax=Spirochaeta isovalerica TaxID=150 RepID=A0A841RFC9_9SPIO|nr:HAMP domain-containing sensor histidine kinase [Spirochaeta isovalerica]MBB6481690.1 signal transduction histidine kinase [Spirochaeta isovalerica]